jgi:uridine kinase
MPTELTFQTVLDLHARRYPLMQIQDLVKLAYQAAFAGGHMIDDEVTALNWLQVEFDALSLPPGSDRNGTQNSDRSGIDPAAFFEPIGNSLCRIHLQSVACSGLSLETLNRFFVLTANRHHGEKVKFEQHLTDLESAVQSGLPLQEPIHPDDLAAWLQVYRQQGCPAIHHSETYRLAYQPAYRVVRTDFARFTKLFAAIDGLLQHQQSVTVAIDGNSGSGKSTLATLVHDVYGGNLFHMDDYFLQPHQRTDERLGEAGGNVDRERFQAEIITGLASQKTFTYRIYDCKTQTLGQPAACKPERLNLIEGVYSQHPSLREAYDLKVLLRVDPGQQRRRVLARSGPELYKRFIAEWIPMEDRYFADMQIAEQCDLVFDDSP